MKKLSQICVVLILIFGVGNFLYADDKLEKKTIKNSNENTQNKKIIHDFKSDEEMKQFINIIQIKQASLTKISVLQEFLLNEKAKLDQINGQLMLKFRIDPNKDYNLDPKNKNLLEVEKK